MPSTLLIHPTRTGAVATEVTGAATDVAVTGGGPLPLRPDGLTRAGHWSATSLPSRLNRRMSRARTDHPRLAPTLARRRHAATVWTGTDIPATHLRDHSEPENAPGDASGGRR